MNKVYFGVIYFAHYVVQEYGTLNEAVTKLEQGILEALFCSREKAEEYCRIMEENGDRNDEGQHVNI